MLEVWAIIFKPWPDVPVYHGLSKPRLTKCGRSVGSTMPMLPMKHAKKFGRPCRSCYPS